MYAVFLLLIISDAPVDTQVTGDASEEQVLLSVETYVDTVEFLIRSVKDLFQLTKNETCVNQRRALEVRQRQLNVLQLTSLYYCYYCQYQRANHIIRCFISGNYNHLLHRAFFTYVRPVLE